MIKKLVIFLIALLPVGLMAQDVKLGHVNFREVVSLMPELTDIDKKLNDFQSEVEKEIVKMREEYNAKLKDFVDNQATMPETIKQARQAEIADLEQRTSTFSQNAQQDYNNRLNRAQSITGMNNNQAQNQAQAALTKGQGQANMYAQIGSGLGNVANSIGQNYQNQANADLDHQRKLELAKLTGKV